MRCNDLELVGLYLFGDNGMIKPVECKKQQSFTGSAAPNYNQ